MDQAALEKAVSLALNPQEGTPFTFGGKEFRLQYLTCEGEERLVSMLMPRIKALVLQGETSNTKIMAAINDLLPEAVAVILGDYTFAGTDPRAYDEHVATTLAWVRQVRAPRVRMAMYDLVAAQFEVIDLGKFLAERLQSDAMLQALDALAE